jgi:hypothetical protein
MKLWMTQTDEVAFVRDGVLHYSGVEVLDPEERLRGDLKNIQLLRDMPFSDSWGHLKHTYIPLCSFLERLCTGNNSCLSPF